MNGQVIHTPVHNGPDNSTRLARSATRTEPALALARRFATVVRACTTRGVWSSARLRPTRRRVVAVGIGVLVALVATGAAVAATSEGMPRGDAGRLHAVASAHQRPSPGGTFGAAASDAATTGATRRGTTARASVSATSTLDPPPNPNPLAPARFLIRGPDAPNAFVLPEADHYLLFTSQGNLEGVNIPVYEATAPSAAALPGAFGPVHDALPDPPAWLQPGFTWAPDVVKVRGGWALYFNGLLAGVSPPMQCIGAAFASDPAGPFHPLPEPFICQRDHRGSIDARAFVDANGQLWLDWKSDDNADPNVPGPDFHGRTTIWAERLSPDGRQLLGEPVALLRADEPWQGTIVEAPDMVLAGGHYWLFYSGGWFNQPGYGIGVALCAGPAGPCADLSPRPWLGSNAQGAGPGEESLFHDASGWWMVYAPWASRAPNPTPPRPVAIVHVGFGPLGPYLAAWPRWPSRRER
jgi:hypothetical protein